MVVYVGGTMRSGTTLLGQIVAASPDTVFVGEIKPVLVQPGLRTWCDCGLASDECPVWKHVDVAPLSALGDRAASSMSIKSLARTLIAALLHRPMPADTALVLARLDEIAGAANGKTIIDTSKSPVGIILWRLAGQRVDVAHCIRSAREVAEAQADPDAGTGIPPQRKVNSYLLWALYNAGTWVAARSASSYTVVRYRALRSRPGERALTIWARAGLSPAEVSANSRDFRYLSNHVLSGNPRRSRDGLIHVQP